MNRTVLSNLSGAVVAVALIAGVIALAIWKPLDQEPAPAASRHLVAVPPPQIQKGHPEKEAPVFPKEQVTPVEATRWPLVTTVDTTPTITFYADEANDWLKGKTTEEVLSLLGKPHGRSGPISVDFEPKPAAERENRRRPNPNPPRRGVPIMDIWGYDDIFIDRQTGMARFVKLYFALDGTVYTAKVFGFSR
jgi:hypothetical protein